ncbi:MAG: hypothetical protein WBO82_06245 [Neisseria sp.]
MASKTSNTISRRPRRNHSPTFKAKLALAAMQNDKTLAQLAEQFDLHANQIVE